MWKATCQYCDEAETVPGDFKTNPSYTKFYFSWLSKNTRAWFCRRCKSQAYENFLGQD